MNTYITIRGSMSEDRMTQDVWYFKLSTEEYEVTGGAQIEPLRCTKEFRVSPDDDALDDVKTIWSSYDYGDEEMAPEEIATEDLVVPEAIILAAKTKLARIIMAATYIPPRRQRRPFTPFHIEIIDGST